MLENPKGILQGGSADKYLAKTGTEFPKDTERFCCSGPTVTPSWRDPAWLISYRSAGADHAARRLVTERFND
jgi:hypothetical protein